MSENVFLLRAKLLGECCDVVQGGCIYNYHLRESVSNSNKDLHKILFSNDNSCSSDNCDEMTVVLKSDKVFAF